MTAIWHIAIIAAVVILLFGVKNKKTYKVLMIGGALLAAADLGYWVTDSSLGVVAGLGAAGLAIYVRRRKKAGKFGEVARGSVVQDHTDK